MVFGGLLVPLFVRDTPHNSIVRHGAFYGMGFGQGWAVAPLVGSTLAVNPSTVLTTVIGTAAIFGSFTMSAYYSPRRQYLYLGGILGTLVIILMLAQLVSAFGIPWMGSAELYLGLLVFSLYVLYDTQVIVERAEAGSRDPILHGIMLFTDLAAIFARLLIILNRSSRDRDSSDKRRR